MFICASPLLKFVVYTTGASLSQEISGRQGLYFICFFGELGILQPQPKSEDRKRFEKNPFHYLPTVKVIINNIAIIYICILIQYFKKTIRGRMILSMGCGEIF